MHALQPAGGSRTAKSATTGVVALPTLPIADLAQGQTLNPRLVRVSVDGASNTWVIPGLAATTIALGGGIHLSVTQDAVILNTAGATHIAHISDGTTGNLTITPLANQ